jgi:hypothetical protein
MQNEKHTQVFVFTYFGESKFSSNVIQNLQCIAVPQHTHS